MDVHTKFMGAQIYMHSILQEYNYRRSYNVSNIYDQGQSQCCKANLFPHPDVNSSQIPGPNHEIFMEHL